MALSLNSPALLLLTLIISPLPSRRQLKLALESSGNDHTPTAFYSSCDNTEDTSSVFLHKGYISMDPDFFRKMIGNPTRAGGSVHCSRLLTGS